MGQPRKTLPCLTEILLMGRKESNKTKQTSIGSTVGSESDCRSRARKFIPGLVPYMYFRWFKNGCWKLHILQAKVCAQSTGYAPVIWNHVPWEKRGYWFFYMQSPGKIPCFGQIPAKSPRPPGITSWFMGIYNETLQSTYYKVILIK